MKQGKTKKLDERHPVASPTLPSKHHEMILLLVFVDDKICLTMLTWASYNHASRHPSLALETSAFGLQVKTQRSRSIFNSPTNSNTPRATAQQKSISQPTVRPTSTSRHTRPYRVKTLHHNPRPPTRAAQKEPPNTSETLKQSRTPTSRRPPTPQPALATSTAALPQPRCPLTPHFFFF